MKAPGTWRRLPIALLAILIVRASAQRQGAPALNCSTFFGGPVGPSNTTLIVAHEQINRVSGDLQLLVDCVPPDGKLLFNVSKVQPLKRIVIDKPLVLGSHIAALGSAAADDLKMVLECPEGDGVLLLRSHGVRIVDIAFANCRTTSGVAPVQLQNCKVANSSRMAESVRFLRTAFHSNENQNGTGGALSVSNCTAILEDSTFVDNKGVDSAAIDVAKEGVVSVLRCDFFNNTAASTGGALGAKGQMLTIEECRFARNRASANGGAIFSQSVAEASISISSSLFEGNEVLTLDKIGGGAIFLEGRGVSCSISDDVKFLSNRAALAGGAIAVVNGTNLSLGDSTFLRNAASRGGALYIESEPDVTVSAKNVVFVNNSAGGASHHGGAVELWRPGATLNLLGNVTFMGNKAQGTGGAVSMGRGATLNVTNALFLNNSAVGGGAISLQPYAAKSVMLVSDTLFESNNASADGGAVVLMSGRARVLLSKAVRFVSNSAARLGGAVAAFDAASFNSTSAVFTSNSAGEGGALYVKATGQNFLTIVNSTFSQNMARSTNGTILGQGGAISISGPLGNGTVRESVFLSNVAQQSGGALKAYNSVALHLTACSFSNNTAKGEGGAVAVEGVSKRFAVSASSFTNNAAAEAGGAIHMGGNYTEVELQSIRFARNAAAGGAGVGGAIHSVSTKLYLNVTGRTIFEDNIAAVGAGCDVRFAIGGNLKLRDAQFRRNQAIIRGGGLSVSSSAFLPIVLDGVSFSWNEAQQLGGGLALSELREMNITMLHAAFFNNSVVAHGGAMSIDTSSSLGLKLVDVEFADNIAGANGGAVHIESHTAILRGGAIDAHMGPQVRFSGNQAQRGHGGAIFVTGTGVLEIMGDGIQFDDNSAVHGGAISSNPSTNDTSITLMSTLFLKNQADTGGGAIELGQATKLALKSSVFRANTANSTSGGAIHVTSCSDLTVANSTFTENGARLEGGALFIEHFDSDPSRKATVSISGSRFINNSAGSMLAVGGKQVPTSGRGGGCLLRGSAVSSRVVDSKFKGNKAAEGGALHWAEGDMQIDNTSFVGNTAMLGGACFLELSAQGAEANGPVIVVLMADSTFLDNEALLGGAVFAHSSGTCVKALSTPPVQSINISSGYFARNIASEAGAALYIGGVRVSCHECAFWSNRVSGDVRGGCGGAMKAVDQAIANVTNSVFWNNGAPNGGALCVDNSVFNGTLVNFTRNLAMHNGGAVEVLGSRSKLIPGDVLMGCRDCHLMENQATDGGGVHFLVQNSSSAEVCNQLQDSPSTFDAVNWLLVCGADGTPIRDLQILLENTTVLNNMATRSGGALFTNVPDAVRVCCNCSMSANPSQLQEGLFLGSSLLKALAGVCTSQWVPNMVLSEGVDGNVFGTSISRISLRPSSVAEHRSGTPLEPIQVVLQDEFDQVVRDSRTLVSVSAPSNDSIRLLGQIVSMAENGVAVFDGLIVWALPGTYTLTMRFMPDDPLSTIEPVQFTVAIRECLVGEVEAEDGFQCKVCSYGFHGLDPTKEECTPCHANAFCNGTTITPKLGFWHSSSKSTEVHACIVADACLAPRARLQEAVGNASDETVFFGDEYPQCTPGYDGVLCGSCSDGYGQVRVHQCKECTSTLGSAAGFGAAVMVTVLIAAIFIRRTDHASAMAFERMHLNHASVREPLRGPLRPRRSSFLGMTSFPLSLLPGFSSTTIEMVGMDGEGDPAESNLAGLVDGTATSDGGQKWNHRSEEAHRRSVRVVEILKITVNFLQVTSAAALLRFNWTTVMIRILDVQDLLSGFSNGSGLFSLECLFPSGLPVPKSILAISIGTITPLLLAVICCLSWLLATCMRRSGWLHLVQRLVMTYLVVVYLAWWDTWNRLFRVFHCTKADVGGGPFATAGSRYWLEDTDVECFKDGHLHMAIGLGLPTFLVLSLTWGFMLGYLVMGVRRHRDRQYNVAMFGFFYQGFRQERWYWDVVVMLRKLILAGLVVASYDDEHGSEENIAGVSAVVLLAISLVAQAYAMPYRDFAADLNQLEMASVASSLMVFLSGVIFNHEELSQIGRLAFSTLAICAIAATLGMVLYKLVRAGRGSGAKGEVSGSWVGSWLARMGLR